MLKVRLSLAIDEYTRYQQARGLRPNSVRASMDALMPMLRETGDIYVCNITPQHVERFFTKNTHWKESTRNQRLGHLKAFLRWSAQRGYIDPKADPLFGWRTLPEPEKEHLRVPVQEWPRLFAACRYPTETAAIAVGLYLFTRSSETAALRVGDVRFHDHTALVTRIKTGGSQDALPMSTELESILRDYLTWYAERCEQDSVPMGPDSYLVPPRNTRLATWPFDETIDSLPLKTDRPYTKLGLMVHNIIDRAGYSKIEGEGWGGHVLRRSGARALFDELVAQGYDGALKTVQAMLGHKNAAMTERYLGLTLDRERRNTLLAGKPMFPSMSGANVITMQPGRGSAERTYGDHSPAEESLNAPYCLVRGRKYMATIVDTPVASDTAAASTAVRAVLDQSTP